MTARLASMRADCAQRPVRFELPTEWDTQPVGPTWISGAETAAEPLATTWTPQLKQATDSLDEASQARNQSVQALGSHQTTVTLFVDDVNCELDRLEGQLKLLFPGNAPRVASYLAVTRPQRAAVPDDPQPPAPQPPVLAN